MADPAPIPPLSPPLLPGLGPRAEASGPLRHLHRLAAGVALLLAVVAAVYGTVSWQIEREREVEQLRSVLRLGERAIDQYFLMMEAALAKLALDVVPAPGAAPDPARAQPLLVAFRQRHPEVVSANLVRIDGQVLATSQTASLQGLPSVADMPAFQRFVAGLTPETRMGIGRPLLGPIAGTWLVPMRFVLRDAAGRPQALVSANLPVGFLQTFWQDAPLVRRGSIGLLRDDGYLVSRHPVAPGVTDDVTYGRERGGALRLHLLQAGFPAEGVVQGHNQLGGAEFLNVYMRLRHQPLTLFTAVPMSEVRAGWWANTRVTWGLLALLASGGLLLWRVAAARQRDWLFQRQRQDDQVQASEQRWRLLFEHSLDAVLQVTADGRILAANAAACRIFGADDATLRSWGQQGLAAPGDGRLALLAEQCARTGQARGRVGLRRGDGTVFEGELASAAYTGADGQAMVSAVFRDVSDEQRAESAERARQGAEQASRAKSEFIARMSHELRTPLNAILGFAELMRADRTQALSPIQAERLGHVQHAGDHLLLLINDLLDLSRIESGRLTVQLADVDLAAVLQHAVREVAADAAARRVTVVVDPAGPLPPARADRTRLLQVVQNLLSNAVKYNRPGGEVRLHCLHQGDRLRLEVHDTGLGLTEAQRAALFQPFNRLGREGSDVPGTGIGLVIARTLVELMHGQLVVESRSGQGSVFSVTLPCGVEVAAAPAPTFPVPAALAAPVVAADAGRPGADTARPRHVLYIDDEPVNRLLVQAMLATRPGLSLDLAEDGASGLALARRRWPDVVLVDMMMPGMDGTAVLAALRREPGGAALRVVAVSANAMAEDIAAARAAGFDDYVTKPIGMDLLLAAVEAHPVGA